MDETILPYNTSPIFRYTPRATYLLSILQNYKGSERWISQNYVNICIGLDDTIRDMFCDNDKWLNCEHLDISYISYEWIINSYNNFTDFVISSINQGYYVYTEINTKYIQAYESNTDFSHNPIIYGYKSRNKKIYFSDFFMGGKYSFLTCSYDDLNMAFKKFKDSDGFTEDPLMKTQLLKVCNLNFKFDIEMLKQEVTLFLNQKNNSDAIFGINCYNYISEKILETDYYNKRVISLFLAVSQLWLTRIDVIKELYTTDLDLILIKKLAEDLISVSRSNQLLLLKLKECKNYKDSTIIRQTISKNIIYAKEKLLIICNAVLGGNYKAAVEQGVI